MGWKKTEKKKSCHYCQNMMSTTKEENYRCRKGGLDGEIIPRYGNGRMTLWRKMEMYQRQGKQTELSLRLAQEAEQCEHYDGEA